MKAWRLERLGGPLTFEDMPVPEVRPGSALLRIQASPLLSYLKQYVEGKLPFYNAPQGAFTPGTNGVGVIEAVGRDVWHLKPGQRVVFSPHFVAGENVEDPAQILIGLTAFGGGSAAVQADWRDGSLAEYAPAPITTITPADGLEIFDAAQLAVPKRFIVPFGGVQIAFDMVGKRGGRRRHARFAQQPAAGRQTRSNGQHDRTSSTLLQRCYAQRLGDHRAVYVPSRCVSPPDRHAAHRFARYQRDPPGHLSARGAAGSSGSSREGE